MGSKVRKAWILGGAASLALWSAWAIAQDSPESLLPPGFDKPRASQQRPPAANTPARTANAPSTTATPMVQPLPGVGATPAPTGARMPSLKELETMSPDQLDELLGLKPRFDMPAGARRAMSGIGLIDESEGGFGARSLARQSPALVRAALTANNGQMVSRWGHILLRRALASRLDAPNGYLAADFAADRAALLLRMGEGEAARALVQDVDAGNYSVALTRTAVDSYLFTADITGICPVVAVQGGLLKDTQWRVLRAICQVYQGDGAAGMAQLDRMRGGKVWPNIDMLLAERYAGAAGKSRKAVRIEWNGVSDMNPWRYALTIAVGLQPPDNLMQDLPVRYAYVNALAPMVGLETRATGADRAAAAGILSSAAMVDLYGQIYAQEDITGDWANAAQSLRDAYIADSPSARLSAIRTLWDGASDPQARYSRQVLTAYAAARLPLETGNEADAADLIASMLAAGLDANALRWAPKVGVGSLGWAMLALAAPQRPGVVEASALDNFYNDDHSDGERKSRFLVAGLLGLNRVDQAVAGEFATKLGIDLNRRTRWTRLIDQAADVNNRELVVLLAGLGMQGDGWDKMTSVHLYHIVSALNRVGLGAEARMIAAEAVARG